MIFGYRVFFCLVFARYEDVLRRIETDLDTQAESVVEANWIEDNRNIVLLAGGCWSSYIHFAT